MDETAFKAAYNESRNGTNTFIRNLLYRTFVYSEGVRDCADAGCYWLLDILGTELPLEFKRRPDESLCVVKVKVQNGKATILGEFVDDDPAPYQRQVDYTDMPEGEWVFYVEHGGELFYCILPTEY